LTALGKFGNTNLETSNRNRNPDFNDIGLITIVIKQHYKLLILHLTLLKSCCKSVFL